MHYKMIFALMVLTLFFISLNVDAVSNNSKYNLNDNETSLAKRVELSLDTCKTILSSLTDIIFSLIKIIIIIFLFYSAIMFIYCAKNDNNKNNNDENLNITIFPFEIAKSDDKYNGKAIADLLFAELQRIKQINDDFFDVSFQLLNEQGGELGRYIRKSERNPNPERDLIIPLFTKDISEQSRTDTLISLKVGSINLGPASISISEAVKAIKLLFLDSNETITGSLQNYGPNPKIVASLTGARRYTWEVSSDNGESSIPNLVRDLSFKIVSHLSKYASEGYNIKSWEAAKYYTESLDNYSQYRTTLKTKFLEKSRISCIRAINSEKEYNKAVGLLNNLGVEYFIIKDFDKAAELFRKATEISPYDENPNINLVKTFNAWGKKEEAEKAKHKYEVAKEAISLPLRAKAMQRDQTFITWASWGLEFNK